MSPTPTAIAGFVPRELSPVKQSLLEKRLRGALKPRECSGLSHNGHARQAGSALIPLQPSGTKPPLVLIHGAGGGLLWGYRNLAAELGPDQPVYAIEPRSLPNWRDLKTIEEMAAAYVDELKAFKSRGPYFLGGYCFGGLIAFELARQLWMRCEPVAGLVLIDAPAPNGIYQHLPWWRPVFQAKFLRNLYYWGCDFCALKPAARQNFLKRKIGVVGRKIWGRITNRKQPDRIDLEKFIDTARFPEEELLLWQMHLKAEADYGGIL